MSKVSRFEELEVWQEARAFAIKVFELTHDDAFPRDLDMLIKLIMLPDPLWII